MYCLLLLYKTIDKLYQVYELSHRILKRIHLPVSYHLIHIAWPKSLVKRLVDNHTQSNYQVGRLVII